MAKSQTQATQKPLIQIDDEVREMTDEEYAEYQAAESAYVPLPTG
jgi:hypothetical protein